jgi:hypothetical protein
MLLKMLYYSFFCGSSTSTPLPLPKNARIDVLVSGSMFRSSRVEILAQF